MNQGEVVMILIITVTMHAEWFIMGEAYNYVHRVTLSLSVACRELEFFRATIMIDR